ncbi:MAG TPA: 30S ribosomal protein S6 [Opitutales bacterium]|nr:30S ribosomal protein S6 [Opitutales bacterium]
MTDTQQRNYRATIILDTRNYDQPIETLVGTIKDALTGIGASVGEVRDLGRIDFIRTPDKNHTGDVYIQIALSGAPDLPAKLAERFRLEKAVKRTLVESV